jgi:hypothetical protein
MSFELSEHLVGRFLEIFRQDYAKFLARSVVPNPVDEKKLVRDLNEMINPKPWSCKVEVYNLGSNPDIFVNNGWDDKEKITRTGATAENIDSIDKAIKEAVESWFRCRLTIKIKNSDGGIFERSPKKEFLNRLLKLFKAEIEAIQVSVSKSAKHLPKKIEMQRDGIRSAAIQELTESLKNSLTKAKYLLKDELTDDLISELFDEVRDEAILNQSVFA